MGPIGSIAWGISSLAKAGYNISTKGRVLGQAALGAGIGALTSDSDSATNRFYDILGGATYGAIGGGVFHALKNPTSRRMLGQASRWAGQIYGPGAWRAAVGGAIGAGKFALENPLTTLGIAGGLYALAGSPDIQADQQSSVLFHGRSVGLSANMTTDFNQQALALDTMNIGNISPMRSISTPVKPMSDSQYSFMYSTQGLTLGLHNSRHGRG
jgi:hypothetical protein